MNVDELIGTKSVEASLVSTKGAQTVVSATRERTKASVLMG